MKFSDLSKNVQDALIERYSYHKMDGVEAFNVFLSKFERYDLDPSGFLKLSEEDQLKLFDDDFKEISHIKSQKNHHELADDPNNVIIEDRSLNRSRSSRNMTPEEEEAGLRDFVEDIKDGDINEDGIIDLNSALNEADNNDAILDIIGFALPIGIVMSGVQVVNKVKNKELVITNAPKEYAYKVGEQSIKVAAVGTLLASGSPVLVGGTSAVLIYKNRKLLDKFTSGIHRAITSDTAKKIVSQSGKAVISTGKFAGMTLVYTAKGAFNIATHTNTKKSIKFAATSIAKGSKLTAQIAGKTVKGAYNVVTHDVTKKSIKGVGKTIFSTGKLGIKVAKSTGAGIGKIFKSIKKKKNV